MQNSQSEANGPFSKEELVEYYVYTTLSALHIDQNAMIPGPKLFGPLPISQLRLPIKFNARRADHDDVFYPRIPIEIEPGERACACGRAR